jgi:hypothetical protein
MSLFLNDRTHSLVDFRLDDFLSGTIYYHCEDPQGNHIGPLFFKCIEDCKQFQCDLKPLRGWYLVNKFDLNAGEGEINFI